MTKAQAFLAHHGIKGQKWGVRRFQNEDGTLTAAGQRRYLKDDVLFVSGSSKTQDENSGYYRKELPRAIRRELDKVVKAGSKVVVGDAPGVDRQVQNYLNKKQYKNVEIYGPGKQVRYNANNKDWKVKTVNDPKHPVGSKEWLAKKDEAMTNASTKGLAVVIDDGAKATRANVERLKNQNKDVKVYSLNKGASDRWVSKDQRHYDTDVDSAKERLKIAKEKLKEAQESDNVNAFEKASRNLEFARRDLSDEKIKTKMNQEAKVSNHRLKLEEKYKKQGMSSEDAAIAAYRRARTEKIVAIAAVTTIAAATAYVGASHLDRFMDKVVPKGTKLQNISTDINKGVKDAFYAAYENSDKEKYVGLYGGDQLRRGFFGIDRSVKVFKLNAEVGEGGLRVAGEKASRQAFEELMQKNKTAKDAVLKYAREYSSNPLLELLQPNTARLSKGLEKRLSRGLPLNSEDHDMFNMMLVNHKPDYQPVIDEYYSSLRKKGYDALADVNDRRYSGYLARNPLIVINGAEKIASTKVSEIPSDILDRTNKKATGKLMARYQARTILARLAPTAAGIPLAATIGKTSKEINDTQKYNEAIKKYKRMHPNTTLTDKEILRTLYA